MDSDETTRINHLWQLTRLIPPYQNIIVMERYVCRDSVVVVFTTETGYCWAVLTPFN